MTANHPSMPTILNETRVTEELNEYIKIRKMAVMLATRLHLLLRSRMMELYTHSPTCFHGVVLN
jgi:hypothetical protein